MVDTACKRSSALTPVSGEVETPSIGVAWKATSVRYTPGNRYSLMAPLAMPTTAVWADRPGRLLLILSTWFNRSARANAGFIGPGDGVDVGPHRPRQRLDRALGAR